MKGLNIHRLVGSTLQAVTPLHDVIIKSFTGQTKDDDCNWLPSYTDISAKARIQLENTQTLQHIQSLDLTKIYKRFYIEINQLTGLNRNISSGGDYIQYNGLYYKIVEIKNDFSTGWFSVVGCESSEMGE